MLGELATDRLLVALNKVDLLPPATRDKLVVKARKRLAQTFALTKFAGCTMVPVAAKPGAARPPASFHSRHGVISPLLDQALTSKSCVALSIGRPRCGALEAHWVALPLRALLPCGPSTISKRAVTSDVWR